MSLEGTYRVTATVTNTKDGVDLTTPAETLGVNISKSVATGKLYHDTVALSADHVYTIDVGDGSLSDVYGTAISLSGITGLYVEAASTNTVDFTVSGIANSMVNTLPAFGASEGIGILADIDVTTNSKLCIVNGAAAGSVDIAVTGDE